jgi:SAM-dependent methyltransferase
MTPYRRPAYYELAFGFVDPAVQADRIERLVRRHSRIRVRRVLDLCCGPSLQLRELLRRGYRGVGLDRSTTMLTHLRARVPRDGAALETVRADLRDFRLRRPADLATIFMGSIGVLRTDADHLRHLRAMARALRPGGLYLIENLSLARPGRRAPSQAWTMVRDGIRVRASYAESPADAGRRAFRSRLRLDVNDRGRRVVLEERGVGRRWSPAGFRALAERDGRFECVAWLSPDWRTPLRAPSGLNLVVLRARRVGPQA